ncbi:MAG: sigma-70 family RNA polymerase sigma factor [Luteolibacter sp.]|uniref:RNA polymerase sigma factor n=1 Tax=Luteolibacter sp. TaxID=1962973 RepID=UPI003264D38B
MQNAAPSDAELLADWLGHQRESAFHALVARYAGLVHMAARRISGDETLAAEAAQLTFILLARKAKSLTSRSSLAGWLHLTAVMQAKNLMRKNRRENRKRELLKTAMETEALNHSGDSWKEMQPVLDGALAALSNKDREALLLRFYRSLSVREIAVTLGIATDAAQKRIDRATERLRGKLAKRGCLAGGAMGAAMVAGFAADAQAAVPAVSLLASKAIAAGAIVSGGGILAHISAIGARPLVFVLTFVVLVTAGTWITHRQPPFTGAQEADAALEKRLSERSAARDGVLNAVSVRADQAIDWKRVGLTMNAARRKDNQDEYSRLWNDLMKQLAAMRVAKLSSSLDEIAKLDMPADCRDLLEDLLLDSLARKNPELLLTRHFNSVYQPKCFSGSPSCRALMDWAEKNPYEAEVWLDGQISGEGLDRAAPAEDNEARIELEASLLTGLIPVNFEAAANRLLAMPEDQRAKVLKRHPAAITEPDQRKYVEFVRTHLPPDDQIEAIVALVKYLPLTDGYSPVSLYLDRIGATDSERESCVEMAASERLLQLAVERNVTLEDFNELRDWIASQDSTLTDRIVGEMLAKAPRYGGTAAGKLSFEDAAPIACKYQADTGRDEVLVSFLKGCPRAPDPRKRDLAGKISDPVQRKEIMDRFESR